MVDNKEHLSLSFSIIDTASKAAMTVHQAFVCLTHIASSSEIHYLAESGTNKNYKFELDLNASAADFASKVGDYSMLGDAVIANPTSWAAATVTINFPEAEEVEVGAYEAKPEIRHLFR